MPLKRLFNGTKENKPTLRLIRQNIRYNTVIPGNAHSSDTFNVITTQQIAHTVSLSQIPIYITCISIFPTKPPEASTSPASSPNIQSSEGLSGPLPLNNTTHRFF